MKIIAERNVDLDGNGTIDHARMLADGTFDASLNMDGVAWQYIKSEPGMFDTFWQQPVFFEMAHDVAGNSMHASGK
jgi:hypothetical protein